MVHLYNSRREGLDAEMRESFEAILRKLKELSKKREEEMAKKMEEKPSKSTRSKTISNKGYSNVMKARSDMTYENGKYKVDTKMNVRPGLNTKEKRALLDSIVKQLNNLFDDCEFNFNEKI